MPPTTPTPDQDRFLRLLADPQTRLLVDLQDLVTRSTTVFWSRRRARNIHLPLTTNSISSPMGLGSDSLPVKIDLFGQPTYLADSMQLMLEYGCRLAADGVWYLMPSFRGEEADERHLNQFFHSEAEIVGTLSDIMGVVEEYVRHITQMALDELEEPLIEYVGTVDHLSDLLDPTPFPRLTLDEAQAHLGDDTEAIRQAAGSRLLTAHGERRLMDEVHPVVWVTHFDHLSVPFYQAYADGGTEVSLSGDLLFGVGEVVGCGQRHRTGCETRDALRHHRVPEEDYNWYVRMKDQYPLLTSGFGMGVERWLMWVLRHGDIRDMALLPRYNGQRSIP